MARSVLLIDDDPSMVRSLERFFTREGWEVAQASSAGEGIEAFPRQLPDLVVLDLELPDMSGLEALAALVRLDATVILLTGHGDISTAVEAMRRGAENFLTKPIRLEHLSAAAERAVEKAELRRANRLLTERLAGDHPLSSLGKSRRMEELAQQVRLVAASDTTALLLGESGTGKGWVANLIHAQSARARGPLVEINCAGLSATFLDSELFGHEKGAFTDAKELKRGLFEVAHGGTLFLDEVGDLASDLQPKLLKVLESRTFRRLGGTREIKADVRLVAATNRNLEQEVRVGRFRADLYYRLKILPLTLPALRERGPEDILELAQRLLRELAGRHRIRAPRMAAETIDLVLQYPWPGNVRELSNMLERALVVSGGADVIRPAHFPAEMHASHPVPHGRSSTPVPTLEDMERRHMERVLHLLDGNRTQVARALGISRATLHTKIKLYSLDAVGRGSPLRDGAGPDAASELADGSHGLLS